MLKLEVENAYGLKGKHAFAFKPGLNVLLCSNAKGASSAVKALGLLVGETRLRGAIHRSTDAATVKLQVDGSEYGVSLKRASGSPAIIKKQLLSEQALDCVVVNEKHPLYGHLESEVVRDFITRASNLSELKEQRNQQEAKYQSKKDQLTAVSARIAGLEQVEAESLNLKKQIEDRKKEYDELVVKAPKRSTITAEQKEHLARLRSEVDRYRDEIRGLEGAIRDKRESCAALEAQLASYAAKTSAERVRSEMAKVKVKKEELSADMATYARCVSLSSALQSLGHLPECPACDIFGIHTDWAKIPDDTFTATLKNFGEERVRKRLELEKRINECVRELRELDNQSRGVNDDISRLKGECADVKSGLNTLNAKLKETQHKLAGANTALKTLERNVSRAVALRIKLTQAKHDLDFLEKQCEDLACSIEELRKAKASRQKLEEQVKEEKKKLGEKEVALAGALNNAREHFNRSARLLLHEIGLKGFREVTIDEDFQIRVVREDCTQPAEELSTSEATTLTILLALAAKRAYFPSIPFFAVDTITTSYNASAHRRFMDYLRRESHGPTILTLLAPYEYPLEVVHDFPSGFFKMVAD
jgi:predicted  nucleic acid-binding Zn-ribbon protein